MKNIISALLVLVFLSAFSTKSFAQDPNWSVSPSSYQFSATYTTSLNAFGFPLENTNDKVAAFVDNEIRGVGNVVYVASADKYVAYLTVYANINGETLDFKMYSTDFDAVVDAKQQATFKIDDNIGSVFQSFVLSNETLSDKVSFGDFNFQGIMPISKRIFRKATTDNEEDTFEFLLPQGTDIRNLTPQFSTLYNATAFIDRKKQVSGAKVLDFTNTITYQILSQNEQVLEDTKIIVNVANNNSSTTTIIRSSTLDYELPAVIDVQFSNEIFGLEREDFNLTNAVISTFTKIDNQNFKVELFPVSEGDFSIVVKSEVVADADNLLNSSSNTLAFKSDNTAPIITNLELKNENSNEYFDITFSEEVINLGISDFELIGTITDDYFISSLIPIVNNNYRLNIVKFGANTGSVFLKVKSDSDISDLANNKIVVQEVVSFYVNNTALIAPVLPDINAECSVTITDIPKITNSISGEIIGTTNDALSYTEQGEYIVNWSFEDTSGNRVVAEQKVIIKDIISPQIGALQDIISECSATVSIPKATDNCIGEVIGTTNDPVFYNKVGTYSVLWSFDDGNGNVTTEKQKITIQDVTAPDFIVLPDVRAAGSITLVAPKTTDNCAGILTATTTNPIFYDQVGQYTVNWFFDDGNGNGITVFQNVLIFSETPTAPILPDLTGECFVNVFETPRITTISGEISATTSNSLNYAEQGEYNIIWNFDLGNGTILQSTQNVIVKDDFAPETASLNDIIAECSVTINDSPTAFDFCAGNVLGTTTDPLTYSTKGEYIINWSFDDGNGNVSTTIQKVTITDSIAPETIVLSDLEAQCSINLVAPKTTDNCGGVIIGTTTDPVFYDNPGVYTINWVFNDGNGNSTSAIQKVTIDSSFPPIAPILEDVIAQCDVTITKIPDTIGNGCSGKVIATTADALTYSQQGEFIIVWNFDYGNGLVLQSNQKVIIKDTTTPILPVLLDITAECSVTVSDIPTTTDNCAGLITGTTSDALSYNKQGNYTINWIFDDGNGNITTAKQKVIVKDTTTPILPVLVDITAECSVTISDIPTTTDNCTSVITGTTTDALSYTNQGTYAINWFFDDGNGNVITATQKVIVKDITAPILPVLADILGECSVMVSNIPTTTDNCTGIITGTTTDALSYTNQGTYAINWLFDDGNGNTTTATQNVIVKDITAPILPVLADILGECSVMVSNIPTTTDNCAGIVTGTTTDALSFTDQGNYTITWVFDDGNGNISKANQEVIIKDITNPTVLANDFTLQLDSSGNGVLLVTDVDNNSTDNCEIATYSLSKTNFMTANLGENTVVFKVTDASGNSTKVNVKITITQASLSVDNFVLSNKILVYPNPVKNKISLSIDDEIEIKKLIIFTVNGRKIWSTKYHKQEINTTNLSKGIYFLNIKTSKGNLIKKFIKI